MSKYNKSKIYKIVCNKTGKIYYGSTIDSLSNRLAKHRTKYNNFKNGKGTSNTAFLILENNDYNIYLVEDVNVDTVEQLRSVERKYIDNNECVNIQKPNRTCEEYYQDNKDKINERRREVIQCECGKTYTLGNKLRHINSH